MTGGPVDTSWVTVTDSHRPLSRWLLVPFLAVCALVPLLGGTVMLAILRG